MAKKNIGNMVIKHMVIKHMVIKHIANPKNWTKKKWAALGVAVLTACVVNQFDGGSSPKGAAKKGQTYAAKVIKVADGDTATVSDTHGATHKIRFAYIDAPETKQAHGIASRQALENLINGKQVQVYVTDVDRYQREVAVISINGLDVNYEQVKNGNAWHYQSYAKKSQKSSEYNKYNAAFEQAQKQKIGLWQNGKKPQAPWEYRAQQRAAQGNSQNHQQDDE
ncbi:thermonuclease family protein [Alysiella filiformis]|uniref:Endonuclease YncB, thermonuclease family n=1 Tax=Alysiella filiformis DSM 16848 TaxID=1120981 RepID=A0A286E6S4_9NEIS|nr:thermonuclease family protein [Alysiella filiformis]QMT31520.1 thermonuclease family protein [Alysiella filiformis]UBQ55468.1 thermonuclease family protein [Alysiella filiformis DSM 16848]SOD66581.1 Endonuclease YncB, thermonuclease family [Alysiella filiformis DSM 16848]